MILTSDQWLADHLMFQFCFVSYPSLDVGGLGSRRSLAFLDFVDPLPGARFTQLTSVEIGVRWLVYGVRPIFNRTFRRI